MIDDLIKILYFDKFIIFYDAFKVKTTLYYSLKII